MGIQEEIANQGLTLLGVVPQDETVYEYDCEGQSYKHTSGRQPCQDCTSCNR